MYEMLGIELEDRYLDTAYSWIVLMSMSKDETELQIVFTHGTVIIEGEKLNGIRHLLRSREIECLAVQEYKDKKVSFNIRSIRYTNNQEE